MKQAIILLLVVSSIFSIMPSVSAQDPPASAEQLRGALESALKSKDTNALNGLVNWQGVSTHMKTMVVRLFADMLHHEIAAVKLSPLPCGFKATNEVNGIRYRPNVNIVGLLDVEYTQKGNAMHLPYGKTGNVFYISGTIEEKTFKDDDLFKTVIDTNSGRYVVVGSDRQTLMLKDKFNKVIWSTNVIAFLKKCVFSKGANGVDHSMEESISSVEIVRGEICVNLGRAFANVNKNTGAVEYRGSD